METGLSALGTARSLRGRPEPCPRPLCCQGICQKKWRAPLTISLAHSWSIAPRKKQARADTENLKIKLDGTKDSLSQALIELEARKKEGKAAHQQGYNARVDAATENYKAQMLGIQDEI
ncbi:hypothetical protein RHSIM_Rhsim10G0124900 [Rhododendron simsii]|uniref:Uncharacterized protein n=1 Tax=Rhododendron simsii TaxID=118357 RepID=A0A834G928_RHOSS|nr:hypothetical protein RHSIM_Rhsim10G0124900 [Rhododendron simsii]